MNLDINLNPKEGSAELTFKLESISSDRNKLEVISILQIIASDFALDPELELEDINSILGKANNDSKKSITFFMDEEGLEVELND